MNRLAIVPALAAAFLWCGCTKPTDREIAAKKIQQVRDNPTMPDMEAIPLLAEGYFNTESLEIEPGDNRIVLVVRAFDLSSMPDFRQDLREQQQRSNRMIRYLFLQQLRKFTAAVRGRQIGELDITLLSAVSGAEGPSWVPSYRLVMQPKQFPTFEAQFDKIEETMGAPGDAFERTFDRSLPYLEKNWKVELNILDAFEYKRSS